MSVDLVTVTVTMHCLNVCSITKFEDSMAIVS